MANPFGEITATVMFKVQESSDEFIFKTLSQFLGRSEEAEYLRVNKEQLINMARRAVPKLPEIIGDGYADGAMVYDTWVCPNCGKHYEIDMDDYKFCPECGQAIDRRDIKIG